MLLLDLVMCKNHPGGTGFKGIKASWRTAETCNYEGPGKDTCKGAASIAVGDPRLKFSCNEVKAWRQEECL